MLDRYSIQLLLFVTAVVGILLGGGMAFAAPESQAMTDGLDCEILDCGLVLPEAVSFEREPGAVFWTGSNASGEPIGWVVLSTDIVDIKAYVNYNLFQRRLLFFLWFPWHSLPR